MMHYNFEKFVVVIRTLLSNTTYDLIVLIYVWYLNLKLTYEEYSRALASMTKTLTHITSELEHSFIK